MLRLLFVLLFKDRQIDLDLFEHFEMIYRFSKMLKTRCLNSNYAVFRSNHTVNWKIKCDDSTLDSRVFSKRMQGLKYTVSSVELTKGLVW